MGVANAMKHHMYFHRKSCYALILVPAKLVLTGR